MNTELIQFTRYALELREGINIGIVVCAPVLCFLFARFAYTNWRSIGRGYAALDRPTKGLIGLAVFLVGDFLRAATIWEILHSKGGSGTYLHDIYPLLIALILAVTGMLCAIRNFTPTYDSNGNRLWWGGHRLWIGSLFVYLIIITLNWSVLDANI